MISGVRNSAFALACRRHGVPSGHGRGYDALPAEVTEEFKGSLARSIQPDELVRAFRVAVEGLLKEMQLMDRDLTERLRPFLLSLDATAENLAHPERV